MKDVLPNVPKDNEDESKGSKRKREEPDEGEPL